MDSLGERYASCFPSFFPLHPSSLPSACLYCCRSQDITWQLKFMLRNLRYRMTKRQDGAVASSTPLSGKCRITKRPLGEEGCKRLFWLQGWWPSSLSCRFLARTPLSCWQSLPSKSSSGFLVELPSSPGVHIAGIDRLLVARSVVIVILVLFSLQLSHLILFQLPSLFLFLPLLELVQQCRKLLDEKAPFRLVQLLVSVGNAAYAHHP